MARSIGLPPSGRGESEARVENSYTASHKGAELLILKDKADRLMIPWGRLFLIHPPIQGSDLQPSSGSVRVGPKPGNRLNHLCGRRQRHFVPLQYKTTPLSGEDDYTNHLSRWRLPTAVRPFKSSSLVVLPFLPHPVGYSSRPSQSQKLPYPL